MDELVWEFIVDNHQSNMWRAKVFGGWLVRYTENVMTRMNTGYSQPESIQGYEWRTAITFLPDINHEWQVKTK